MIRNKHYISLLIWIVGLIFIGGFIGSFTKTEINVWYSTINLSTLTPPNYIFPIAWTILYSILGVCGWLIFKKSLFPINTIKILYISQLILNWTWSPLFFCYHFIGLSLVVLIFMDIIVSMLVYCTYLNTYLNLKFVSIIMIPYLLWILFATYLNFHIWFYN